MSENTGKTKKELRKEILKQRAALEAEEVAETSAEICHMIQALNMYEEAEDLCLYMPIRNEVDLEILRAGEQPGGRGLWHFRAGSRRGAGAGRGYAGGDAGSCFFQES